MPNYTFQDSEARKPYEEPGEYHVTVEKLEFTYASSGNEILKLVLRTSGGALVYDNLVFTDKAWWKIDHALKCLLPSRGVKPPGKGANINLDNDYAEENLLGATGWVNLSKGTTPSGKVRNEVESYNPPKKGDTVQTIHTEPPAPESTTSVQQRAAKEADRAALGTSHSAGGAAPGSTEREKERMPARKTGAAPKQPADDEGNEPF